MRVCGSIEFMGDRRPVYLHDGDAVVVVGGRNIPVLLRSVRRLDSWKPDMSEEDARNLVYAVFCCKWEDGYGES
jgi:hypothetical protein